MTMMWATLGRACLHPDGIVIFLVIIMGQRLKLLPMRLSNDFSHEILTVDDADNGKFEFILALSSMEIDDGFTSYAPALQTYLSLPDTTTAAQLP